MTQMRKFDQIENELSNIVRDGEDDADSSDSNPQNNSSESNEKDEESGEMHFDSNHLYSNNNNNNSSISSNHSNYNEENDDEEEQLHRSRRSHLVEAVSHPLADSAANVPPPSLTSLVSGNAAVPAYMNVVVSEANVNALMDMGFQRNLADFALKTCDDDFDSALDRLLNHAEELQLDILKSLFFFS